MNGLFADRCDHSCYECLGPGERNCSTCVSGYNLEGGACVVSTICKDGEFSGFVFTCGVQCELETEVGCHRVPGGAQSNQ